LAQKRPQQAKNAHFNELLRFKNRNSPCIKITNMKFIKILISPILKAVPALANNGGIFKKRKKAAFNPKITLGFNF